MTRHRLHQGIPRSAEVGHQYTPDIGEHLGHVIEVVSFDGIRFNILNEPLRSVLVRCMACRESWALMPDDDFPEGWPHAEDPPTVGGTPKDGAR